HPEPQPAAGLHGRLFVHASGRAAERDHDADPIDAGVAPAAHAGEPAAPLRGDPARRAAARRGRGGAARAALRPRRDGRPRLRVRALPLPEVPRVIAMPRLVVVGLACLLVTLAAAQTAPGAPFDLYAAIADGPTLTADAAAERAAASAPGIDEARALSRASEASVSRARAAMLPRLELTASYAHVEG